jgi:hypothetical protein
MFRAGNHHKLIIVGMLAKIADQWKLHKIEKKVDPGISRYFMDRNVILQTHAALKGNFDCISF